MIEEIKERYELYKIDRSIKRSKRQRFWNAFLLELGFKKGVKSTLKLVVTPEERGERSAKKIKSFFNFIKEFTTYCFKKIYNGFKWLANALMDMGDHFAKQNNKSKK